MSITRSGRFIGKSNSRRYSPLIRKGNRLAVLMPSWGIRRLRERTRSSTEIAAGYLDWLKTLHKESHGNADLVAHFYRRAFDLLRPLGRFGLIATNTIGQGDTRATGLRWICTHGGTIYFARKRLKWPGQAAVVVSVVHVCRGAVRGPYMLDSHEAANHYGLPLFHASGHDDPSAINANMTKSYQGPIPLGMGFTFDDTDNKGITSSLSEMQRLIQCDPRNAECIFPYIAGEEINDSPTHTNYRFVINFGDLDEHEVRQRWPQLMRIVEDRVRPSRILDKRESYRRLWWQFAEKRGELTKTLGGMTRVLVHAYVSQHLAFTFVPAKFVVAGPQNLFIFDKYDAFCLLQSRVHEVWARSLRRH